MMCHRWCLAGALSASLWANSALALAPGRRQTRAHFAPRDAVQLQESQASNVWQPTSGGWSEHTWSNAIFDCYGVEQWENYALLWPVQSDYVKVVTFQSDHYVDSTDLQTQVQRNMTWPPPYHGAQGCSETMGKSPDEYNATVDWTSSTRHCFTWVALWGQMQAWLREARLAGVTITEAHVLEALGLRPDWSKNTVVELTVRRQDLLRMCYDRENDDDRCASSSTGGTSATWARFIDDVSALQLGLGDASSSEDKVPFTHLGYAYNSAHARSLAQIKQHERAPNDSGVVGFSEFVVRPGSNVRVERIVPTDVFLF